MHETARQSLAILRQPEHFNWSFAVFLSFAIYVYVVEIERRNWNIVLGALALYGLEWFIEMINGFVFHFTEFSPIWTTTGNTIFQILPGLTFEISIMFAVSGVVFLKLLPPDKNMKILGINNRKFLWFANAIFMVALECIVNAWGHLPWNYSWWNFPNVWLIVLLGYVPYMMLAFYVHDHPSMKRKLQIVVGIAIVDVILFSVFAVGLGWM